MIHGDFKMIYCWVSRQVIHNIHASFVRLSHTVEPETLFQNVLRSKEKML